MKHGCSAKATLPRAAESWRAFRVIWVAAWLGEMGGRAAGMGRRVRPHTRFLLGRSVQQGRPCTSPPPHFPALVRVSGRPVHTLASSAATDSDSVLYRAPCSWTISEGPFTPSSMPVLAHRRPQADAEGSSSAMAAPADQMRRTAAQTAGVPPRSLEGRIFDDNKAAAMYAERGAEVAMDPTSVLPRAAEREEILKGTSA